MRGAGSPSSITTDPDNGAGSPSFISSGTGDLGAGSPTVHLPAAWGALITPDAICYSDFGGDIVNVIGVFPTQGPFRCRLTDGVDYFPDANGCYGARLGKGNQCETDAGKRLLTFSLPPLDYGTYDLEVAYGPGFGTTTTFLAAIEIIPRDRALEVWGMRRTFPIWVATGGRTPAGTLSDTSHPTRVPLQKNVEAFTRAAGMTLAESFGRPTTRTVAQDFAYDDVVVVVESTLGFPAEGQILIGKTRYSYTSKVSAAFFGLVQIGISDLRNKPPFTRVVLDAHTLLPD